MFCTLYTVYDDITQNIALIGKFTRQSISLYNNQISMLTVFHILWFCKKGNCSQIENETFVRTDFINRNKKKCLTKRQPSHRRDQINKDTSSKFFKYFFMSLFSDTNQQDKTL